MTVYTREWKTKKGEVKRAFRYDFSVRLPGEEHPRRFKGTVPGRSLNRRLAESYERQVIASVLDGSYAAAKSKPARCPTLQEFAPDYLAFCKGVESKSGEREVQSKTTIINRYLMPHFGSMKLSTIGTEEIRSFMNAQKTAPKPKGKPGFRVKTIVNHVTVLSGLLRYGMEKGHLERMPKIPWPKQEKPLPRFYTFEQASELIEAAGVEPFWHSMILVALRCGLRIGELRALQWRNVDLRAGSITVEKSFSKKLLKPPKNGTPRSVPMPPSVVDALSRHPRRLGSPWVWPSSDGDALKQNEVKHPMWRALERAGLPPEQWHVCRHTYCSHLVMKGVHLVTVMQLAGHSSFEVTLRYAHLAPKVHADAVAKLDEPVPAMPGMTKENAS